MATLNNIRFLLFVSLVIFPAHALDVIFSNAIENFKQKAAINIDIMNGRKTYAGTSNELTYLPQPTTTRVIVYIIDRSRFVEIIRNAVRVARLQIGWELFQWRCELVFLGIGNFDDDEYDLIGGFIFDKIQPHPESQTNLTIETIGENGFDHSYRHEIFRHVLNFGKYQERAQICGGILKARLRSIPSGTIRPVESINKTIRLYGYQPFVKEVQWPVNLANNQYSPEVNLRDPTHNFGIKHSNKKIYLLIISGKEYLELMRLGSLRKGEMKKMTNEMKNNHEVLLIMGVFNFDWTEIDIVTQIILKHSVGRQSSNYNVFTYGYGMFNTYYRNVYDNSERIILKQSNPNVLEIIKGLMGEEVKERAIDVSYSDDGWRVSKEPISSSNGRYDPAEGFQFTFPWVNQKIAFIVYDSTAQNDQINISMVYQCMEELKESGIRVVVIKAINFGMDDIHILAEWIEYHKGIIDSEQIAVFGGGIFDTIFQSYATTYKTSFNRKKNELKRIRNAYAKESDTKRIFAANIDTENYEVWSYEMNTVVNGFYEPDLIPDKKMIETTDGRKIFFIVTSGYNFRQISSIENAGTVTSWFRYKIEPYYPSSIWSVFLVGLDNFGERDSHLFAELVRKQTNEKFAFVLSFGIRSTKYRYKDIAPISIDSNLRIKHLITSCIGLECKLSEGADE